MVFVDLACQTLRKPALQATLRVFGLCGSFVVLVWVVLWFLVTCGFLDLVCASDRAHVVLWIGGLASMLDADDCASLCSLWIAKKICPLPHFVLCFVSSPLGATFTNGENDHG